ncbi:uncharacterized protein EV420DRAFT_1621677 [Desarmillaria tabescens]|uniref:Uncharacterized protein n=1 Tax=Armillaria tabescens TaxID=1929756 RepID=A0AA39K1V8_ARMTA|nr:uncharacterized protein EV420DRAFT_1621677 [Desarmillaria tabescens]KAK0452802.1 hypothetical protein EV420DRAFT_1621677 [Desarmillaria tabescens]
MIALCHSKCWVLQLTDEKGSGIYQRGMIGHVILPPSIEEITSPLCVIFIGLTLPTEEWLRKKAKPLADIEINEDMLDALDVDPVLPFHIQHVVPSGATDSATARYDDPDKEFTVGVDDEVPFQNVVITDVEGDASYADLKAAAWNHIKKNGGGYIGVPHDVSPSNEFNNPALLPMMYPTLFPYGIGGPEDPERSSPLAFK